MLAVRLVEEARGDGADGGEQTRLRLIPANPGYVTSTGIARDARIVGKVVRVAKRVRGAACGVLAHAMSHRQNYMINSLKSEIIFSLNSLKPCQKQKTSLEIPSANSLESRTAPHRLGHIPRRPRCLLRT